MYLCPIQNAVDELSALGVQDIAAGRPPPDVFYHDVIVLSPRLQTHAAIEAAEAVCVPCDGQFKHSVSMMLSSVSVTINIS